MKVTEITTLARMVASQPLGLNPRLLVIVFAFLEYRHLTGVQSRNYHSLMLFCRA